MTVLQTKNLTLAPCRPEDRADFIAMERDPEVMRFLNGGHAVDRDQVTADTGFLMPEGTEPYVWTARRREDGAFVGWFCLWPETETLAELGYRLRRSEWGRGLAPDGASALIDWGFANCGYDIIFASTMAVNLPSRRVMEKIGMRYARTISVDWPYPIAGSEEGEVVYELKRADWNGG